MVVAVVVVVVVGYHRRETAEDQRYTAESTEKHKTIPAVKGATMRCDARLRGTLVVAVAVVVVLVFVVRPKTLKITRSEGVCVAYVFVSVCLGS